MNVGPIQGTTSSPPAPPESNMWDGSSWTNVALPLEDGQTKLTSVSCLGSTFCMAVGGTIGASSVVSAFAATWNGATWTASPAVTPPGTQVALYSVACASAVDCEAVAQYSTQAA